MGLWEGASEEIMGGEYDLTLLVEGGIRTVSIIMVWQHILLIPPKQTLTFVNFYQIQLKSRVKLFFCTQGKQSKVQPPLSS